MNKSRNLIMLMTLWGTVSYGTAAEPLVPAPEPKTAQGKAADAKVSGFGGTIGDVRLVLESAPDNVEPLANTQTPRDVLDLTLMAKWSLNYLAGTVTVENNFASSYGNWPLKMPPFAVGGDKIAIADSEVRNLLAFVLMRKMSGIVDGANVQKGVMERVLGYQIPCGLFVPPAHGDTDVLWATAWATRALIEDFATTGNRESLSRADKALKAVRQYAVESNAQGLLRLAPPKQISLDGKAIDFHFRPSLDFCIVEPFVRYYEVTGDKNMLAVAKGLVDGRLEKFSTKHDSGHTHSHWHSVIPVAHLGAVTGEAKYLDWAEENLNRWSSLRTDYGWFEAVGGYGASETCAVADLLHVCVYLARGGRTAHYDLVERTLRNFLPQEQFFVGDDKFMQLWRKQNYANRDQQMALLRRLEGGFLCRVTPSDRWALPERPEGPLSLEGCCPPTGMTGLYVAWTDIVRQTDKGVFVNMAFNRNSPEAQVVSFLPDQGRLTVIRKQAGTFHVRVPGFAPRDRVTAWRNGQRSDRVAWMNDYVVFAAAKQGEELTVTYPLVEFTQKMKRARVDYTISWKGNTVTGIEPKGKVWPLFEKVPYPIPPYNGEAASRNIPGKAASAIPQPDVATKSPNAVGKMPQLVVSQAVQAGYAFSDWKVTATELSASMVWNGKFFGGAVPKYRLLNAKNEELAGEAMVTIAEPVVVNKPCKVTLSLGQNAEIVSKIRLYLVSPTEEGDK